MNCKNVYGYAVHDALEPKTLGDYTYVVALFFRANIAYWAVFRAPLDNLSAGEPTPLSEIPPEIKKLEESGDLFHWYKAKQPYCDEHLFHLLGIPPRREESQEVDLRIAAQA